METLGHTHTTHITYFFLGKEICHPHRSHKMEPFVQYPEKRQDQPPGIWWKRSHTLVHPADETGSHFGKDGLKVAGLHHVKPLRDPFMAHYYLLQVTQYLEYNTWHLSPAHLWFRPVRGQVSLIHIHDLCHRATTVWVRRRPPTKAARAAQMAKGMEHPYHSRSWLTIPGMKFKISIK